MATSLQLLGALLVALLPLALFLGFVQPSWALYDAIRGGAGHGVRKGGYAGFIFCLWIFASIPYALLLSSSRALRRWTIVALLLTVFVIGGGAAHLAQYADLKGNLFNELQRAKDTARAIGVPIEVLEEIAELPAFLRVLQGRE